MIQNRAIYQDTVLKKLRDVCLSAIVCECYTNALPFRRSTLDDEDEKALASYTMGIVESFGGYPAVEQIAINTKDPAKRSLLFDILRLCNTTAMEAAERIAAKPEKSTEELIAPTLSKEEYAKFIDKGENLDLDHIAEIVKDKVLQTLRDEQTNRIRNEEVNKALRTAIKNNDQEVSSLTEDTDEEADVTEDEEDTKEEKKSKKTEDEDTSDEDSEDEEPKDDSEEDTDSSEEDEDADASDEEEEEDTDKKSKKDEKEDEDAKDDEATESFKTFIARGPFNRADNHKSFFNSIVNSAIEQILCTCEATNLEVDYFDEERTDRLLDVTIESTLPYFKVKRMDLKGRNRTDFDLACEAANYLNAYHTTKNLSSKQALRVSETAMVDAICVYTMLECLHTMNFITPGVSDIRVATEAVHPMELQRKEMVRNLNRYTQAAARAAMPSRSLNPYDKGLAIDESLEALEALEAKIPESVEFIPSRKTVRSAIDNLHAMAEKERRATESVAVNGWYANQVNEGRIAQCNKLASIVESARSTPVDYILLEQAEGSDYLTATMFDATGARVNRSHIVMEGLGSDQRAIAACMQNSRLNGKGMPTVYITCYNGNSRRNRILN